MVAWISLGISVVGLAVSLYYMSKMPGAPRPEGFQAPKIGEGNPIPVLFGTKDIAPQILGYSNLVMGWDLTRPTYYASLHFGLCHGKLDAITAVIADDKVVWRGWMATDETQFEVNSHPEDGDALGLGWVEKKDKAGVHDYQVALKDGVYGHLYARMGAVNAANGAEAGHANDKLAALLGQATYPQGYGVAQVFSGSTPLLVGRSSYLRPWAFRCQRIHYYRGGTAQWYDAKALIGIGKNCESTWKYKVQASADATDYSGAAYDDSGWSTGRGGFSNAAVGAEGYKTTLVGTCISGVDGLSGDHWVERGMKIWLRHTFPAMPKSKYGIWIYHDDSARVWWNGTELTVTPVIDIENYGGEAAGIDFYRFNSRAEVPAALVDDAGPNVIAVRVRDSYDTSGNLIPGSSTEYIFAGVRVGADLANPWGSADINPIHAIREVLNDPIWGVNHPDAAIDDDVFEAAADTCYDENLGISLLWDRQTSAEDFIKEILRHISGVLYIDRTTGKYVVKLIREDYVVGNLLVLDDTNTAKLEDVSQRSTAELVNSVTITYSATPRGLDGALTLHEYGLQSVQGGVVSQKIDYPGFSNYFTAGKAALRDLRVLSSPLRSCTIPAGRVAADLNIGDAFVLDKPTQGFDEQVMRVSSIKLGDGRRNQVKIEAMEDVFYLPTAPVVVPAPIYNPPEVLAPPPSEIKATKFFLCERPDQNDHGTVACCFLGAHVKGGNVPMFGSGAFAEIAPGIMERTTTGPLSDDWLDGVNVDDDNPSGVSSLIGKTVFAYYQGDTSLLGLEEAWQGLYIIDDVGGHWVDYGLPTQAYVSTYARMHRHPDYAKGSDYVAGMTFQSQEGTLYGTKFFTLTTDGVALGTTALVFTETAEPFPWVDERRLLTDGQVIAEGFTGAVIDEAKSGTEGTEFDSFYTLDASPNIEDIPAGQWAAHFEGVWLTADDPGETTTLGVAVYKYDGSTRTLLFEMGSAEIHVETATPLDVAGSAPGFHLERTEQLLLALTIHTTATLVEVNIRFGGADPQTYLLAPITPRDWEIARTEYEDAAFSGGVASIPNRARSSKVVLTEDFKGIETSGWENGDCCDLTLEGASSGTPYNILHNATVGVWAAPLWLDSISHLGVDYGNEELVASPVCARVRYDKTSNVFRLIGGLSA